MNTAGPGTNRYPFLDSFCWARVGLATLFVVLLAATGPTGCGGASCPTYPHERAAELMGAHHRMRAPVRTVRAVAEVEQWGPNGRIRGKVRMLLAMPDRVRFDAIGPFGPVATLTSNGSVFAMHDMREGAFLEGPPCAENVGRLLGVAVPGNVLVAALLGQAPLPLHTALGGDDPVLCDDQKKSGGRRNRYQGQYMVELGNPKAKHLMTFRVRKQDRNAPIQEQHLRMASYRAVSPEQGVLWNLHYADHVLVADRAGGRHPSGHPWGVAFPRKVEFEVPRSDLKTHVRFTDMDLNPSIPEEAFEQTPPPGLPIQRVPCP